MTETPNYHLAKPGYTDPVDIEVLNQNADKIDAALHEKANTDDLQTMTPIQNRVIEAMFH